MSTDNFFKACPICNDNASYRERVLDGIELIKCKLCSFVYANLTDENIKIQNSDFGEAATASYQDNQTLVDELWFESIAQKISLKKPQKGNVLDVGCGNGVLLKQFAQKGWKISGMDLSPWTKQFAQKFGFELYDCELEKSDLADNSFDVVTSTSALEHIPQPYQHIQMIFKILKPGGIAYFSGMPNYGSLSVRLGISDFRNNRPPKHVNYFTCYSLRQLFSRPDLMNQIKSLYIGTYGIPELHKFYGFLRDTAKNINKKTPVCAAEIQTSESITNSSFKRMAAKSFIGINYYTGKFLKMGDKLEVLVIKK